MAKRSVLHFHNDPGVSRIETGARDFMCMGATPPLDHPHVYLDMGDGDEIVCPYCSTLFKYNATLGADEARPPECLAKSKAA